MGTQSNQNITDSDLIRGCIAGEQYMQEKLYSTYSPKLYGVCMRYASNTDDACDLLQEGFIKIFRNLDKFRGEGSFEGWMRRVCVNTCIEHFRKKVCVNSITENEETYIEDATAGALDKMAEKEIIQLIQDLSPGYRTVFNLYVVEGYSHKEIADMLHISEGTSKSQLARAKSILQEKVKTYLNQRNN